MENAADALKIAAAFLVFIIALGISISSFSQARETAQTLLDYTDRETTTMYAEDTGAKTRIVGAETIIPTLYRAYKENYRIIFYDTDYEHATEENAYELYSRTGNDGNSEPVTYIDLEDEVLGTDRLKDNFIMALLYGNNVGNSLRSQNGDPMDFTGFKDELARNNSRITFLQDEEIYGKIIEGNTFEERYGVYYQEDAEETDSDTDISDELDDVQTPDANKTKKRVISYYQQ